MYYLLRTISLLPLLAGVLAHKSPVPSRELGNKSQEDPQQQQQQPPPLAPTATVIPDAGAILDALLKRVQIETIIISATPWPLFDAILFFCFFCKVSHQKSSQRSSG